MGSVDPLAYPTGTGLHQLEAHEVPTSPRAHFMGQWWPILLAAAEAGSRPTARPHRQLRWYRAVPDPQSGFGLAVGSSWCSAVPVALETGMAAHFVGSIQLRWMLSETCKTGLKFIQIFQMYLLIRKLRK
jgi:hypothetical protein